MKTPHHMFRRVVGRFLLTTLLGTFYVSHAQTWNFEGGATHGFTLLTASPATPAANDPTTAGDETLTGVGGPAGLPTNGLAWAIGTPNEFNGLKPAVLEGNHTNFSGLLDYTLNAQPIPAGPNARGQTNYLNTYSLNQWGDNLNSSNNTQIARSPNVVVGANAVLLAWAYGGGSAAGVHPPVDNGSGGYTANSSGIAVRSAADNSLLTSARIDGFGALKLHGIPLGGLAGQTVYVDVVDAFQGGFGWLAVDEIQFSSNTISLAADAVTFEAEDFNFSSGLFIDNPNLILNDANCYYKKGSGSGLQGVDFHEVNPTVHFGIDTVEWRFDGFNAFANLPQTTNSFDAVRSQYVTAGVADYDLATNSIGDWCNYTRTFPNTNAHLYARVASVGAFKIQVDMVSNPTVSGQTLTTRGWFIGNGTGSRSLYETVPMTDSSGSNLLVVAFDGTPKTLRMTSLTAGYAANFYVLDPTNAVEYLLPQAAITSPANFALLPVGALVISATVTDPDSPSGSHTVKFYVDGVEVGQDNTAPYSFTNTMTAGKHTLTVLATDPQGLISLSSAVLVQVGPEEFLYRETFTCPALGVGDKNYNAFGWQVFGVSGQAITLNWINQGSNARTNEANTFSAGPHFDGTFDMSSRGTAFFSTTDVESPSLAITTEYGLNPGDYTPGTLKFSWYQGNANTNSSFRLIIRIGSTWYASATSFSNSVNVALAQFVAVAERKQVIYDPAPANWLTVNFNGDYNHLTQVAQNSTAGTVSLGASPGSPLSGNITAFGLLGTQPAGPNNNRRFDTFTIDTKVLKIDSSSLNGGLLSLVGTGGTTGAGYRILSATDITLPIASWTQSATGTFGTLGTFSNTVPFNVSEPARFHRVVTP